MLRLVTIVLSITSLATGFSLASPTTFVGNQNVQSFQASTAGFQNIAAKSRGGAVQAARRQPKMTTTSLQATGKSSTGEDAVYIDSDFRLAGFFLTAGLLLDQLPILKFTLGPIVTLLGVLFLVQTFRLTFVCDSKAFELLNTSQESGENIVVGGENRWTYDSFVNYEFFPKGWIDQPQGPILVYFKETQTPSAEWNKGPGESANSKKALANGAKPGQVHFFPALCNCQQLKAEWEKRGCAKL